MHMLCAHLKRLCAYAINNQNLMSEPIDNELLVVQLVITREFIKII